MDIVPEKKPHVCFVAPYLLPVLDPSFGINTIGGAEVQQSMISKALVKDGCRVSAICLDYGQENIHCIYGVRVIKAYNPHSGIPVVRFIHPRITSLWKAMKEVNADIYYQRSAGMLTGLVAFFCKKHRKKFVFSGAHNTDFMPGKELIKYERDRFIYHFGLRHADIIVAQNEAQKFICNKYYGLDSVIINSCYEPPAHATCPEPNEILWVSQMKHWKRAEIFINLARQLPDYHFKMIGGPGIAKDGMVYFSQIEKAARGIKNLEFLGFVPFRDVEKHFDTAKIFINTSKTEGFPNTFLQAWARGIPTISFFDTGARSNGKPVCVILKNESDALHVVRELMDNEERRQKLGQLCKKYFETNHSVVRIASEYERLFEPLAITG